MTFVPVMLALLIAAPVMDGVGPGRKPSKPQLASYETLSLCTALIAWSIDNPPEGDYLEEGGFPRVDLSHAEGLPIKKVEGMLVSKYFDKLPGPDPWGYRYEVLRNRDPKQPWSWAARSRGPDGKFCSETYLVPQPGWDRCDDIVRVDGVLVAGPERLDEE